MLGQNQNVVYSGARTLSSLETHTPHGPTSGSAPKGFLTLYPQREETYRKAVPGVSVRHTNLRRNTRAVSKWLRLVALGSPPSRLACSCRSISMLHRVLPLKGDFSEDACQRPVFGGTQDIALWRVLSHSVSKGVPAARKTWPYKPSPAGTSPLRPLLPSFNFQYQIVRRTPQLGRFLVF